MANHTKKVKLIFIAILTAFLVLIIYQCSFTLKADKISSANIVNGSGNAADSNHAVDHNNSEIIAPSSNEYHDLSSDGSITVSEVINGKDIFIIQQKLKTNSHAISIKNNSDDVVTVYLYNSTDLENAIQQFTLKNNTTRKFSNLSASNLYNIGVCSETKMNIQLIISK